MNLGEQHKVINCVLLEYFKQQWEDDSVEEGKEYSGPLINKSYRKFIGWV